jgi:hypothetical protein
MAFILKDRVKETTTTAGTGAVSLGGASNTFDTFQSYMADGDTTYYAIVTTVSGSDEWEVGLGTWNTGNTLTRTTVLSGSNGTSAVNFSAGAKEVFMTYPASKAQFESSSGDMSISNDLAVSGDIDVAGSIEVETHMDLKTTTLNKPSHAEGRIFYDAAFGALAVYNDESEITLQVGQEEYIRVKNDTASTITNGTPVYLTGEDQSTPTIAAAVADGTYAQSQAVGVATHDIEANSIGYITVRGLIADVDTSHLTVGEKVHVAVGGGTTTTAPSYPYFATDVGICLISAASGGCIYVYVETHAFETLRVTDNAHFDGNVTVDGDLTVLGDQTIASSSNISIGNAWNYFNAGDTIGADNTTHTGSGLDDGVLVGHFNGTASKTFYVKIDATGTPDTFSWSDDNFTTTEATGVAITGAEQTLADGVKIEFNATTGHTLGDIWSGTAAPSNVDTGIASNRNTGGSGVGYTHIGLYYDVSTNKWTFFDEYDPEPEGTIDVTDASFAYATVKAGTFEGDVTGDVTGAVTGNVSGNVTGSLTGNVTGNVTGDVTGDVTGNADTATALATARTIQLTGDVTGSATFDGSANVSITAAVQDDSHAHVIGNVDGLQTALDGKVPTTRTITAGNGLTAASGGDLSANRTFTVGGGTGVTINANDVAIGQDVATTASVTFAAATINGNITVTGTVDGRDVATDGTKLDTIETNATADQTGAEIKTAYEAEADTNAFTDALLTKLNGVATGADVTPSWVPATDPSYLTAHPTITAASSSDNSGRTYIQDITLDSNGHVTALATATETVTDTTYTAGGDYGMTLSGTEFRLEDDRRRNSGTVDIYDGNTSDYLHYDADVGIRFYTAGAEEMRLEDDGDLHVDGDVVAFSTTVSDERLKENIVRIENALDIVDSLNGYTFTYTHNGKESAGVIAQEVEKVFPSAIKESHLAFHGKEDEQYKTVQYDQLHGLLIEAIKELKQEIQELKHGSSE